MSLRTGDRLGPYEILGTIGSGGMGEVYRGRDTRLDRDVAIKVLPDAVASDPERLARFDREAKTLAALNHPHIAQIYGVEGPALAMEFVEGEDLSARIARGPISVDDALEIAGEIAEALEAAHEIGIVHRDLKASNIRLRQDGSVKVLDFGLAKALASPTTLFENVSAPTITTPAMTQAGVVLGTAAYMSPEQARGKAVDKRADIWAFGIVLYEMVTGRRPFDGETVSESLAGVLKSEPDWSPVPRELQRLLRGCLEKDPRKRLRDIGDWRRLLDDARPAARARTDRAWLPWSVSGVLAAVAGLVAVLYFGRIAPGPEPVSFQVPPPPGTTFETSLAVSPDGRRVAFTALGADNVTRVWVRDLAGIDARPIAGTDGAQNVAWSPDSRFIAFKVGSSLRRIGIDGGPALTVHEAQSGDVLGGVAWAANGTLLVGGYRGGTIRLIPNNGGTVVPVTALDRSRRERAHGIPAFLPDNRHFLYARVGVDQATSGLFIGSIDKKPEEQDLTRLLPGSHAVFMAREPGPGALIYLRQNTLVAHPFDAGRLAFAGDPVPIVEGVGNFGALGFFSAAGNVIAYRSGERVAGGRVTQLTWLDRQGKPTAAVGGPTAYDGVWLSPDGTRAAVIQVELAESGLGNIDLWTMDLARGVTQRVTSQPGADRGPVWSPKGDRLIFYSNREGVPDLYVIPSNGGATEEVLLKTDQFKIPTGWSSDGRFLLYQSSDPKTAWDIWLLPLEGERTPEALVRSDFAESAARFSHDMKWIAYVSEVSGRPEVYVRPFTAAAPASPSAAVRVSSDGGRSPRWRRDGRELMFENLDGGIMAADLAIGGTAIQPGTPKQLFMVPQGAYWDVTADGQRFLVTMPTAESGLTPITVLLNWAPK